MSSFSFICSIANSFSPFIICTCYCISCNISCFCWISWSSFIFCYCYFNSSSSSLGSIAFWSFSSFWEFSFLSNSSYFWISSCCFFYSCYIWTNSYCYYYRIRSIFNYCCCYFMYSLPNFSFSLSSLKAVYEEAVYFSSFFYSFPSVNIFLPITYKYSPSLNKGNVLFIPICYTPSNISSFFS